MKTLITIFLLTASCAFGQTIRLGGSNGVLLSGSNGVVYSGTTPLLTATGAAGLSGTAPALVSGSAFASGTAGYAAVSGSAAQSGTAGYASTSGSAAVSGSAQTSSMTTGLGPNVQPSGIVYVTTTGTDSSGVRNDIGHPFATLDAAQTVAQPGDIVQVGPGTFALSSTFAWTKSYTWVRGSGKPGYSADETHLVGGTIFTGLFSTCTSGTSIGCRFSDFGVDRGLTVSGTTPDTANCITAGWHAPGPAVLGFRFEHLSLLGNNFYGSVSAQGLDFQSQSGGTVDDVEVRRCGFGMTVWGGKATISNYRASDCTFYGLCIEQVNTVPGCPTSNVTASNLVFTGTGDMQQGVLVQDLILNNTSPLNGIVINNLVSHIGGAPGVTLSFSGTAVEDYGIEVNNEVSDGLADNIIYNTGALVAHVQMNNCTSTSGFVADGDISFSNCSAVGAGWAWNLYLTHPYFYASFSNCTARNCNGILLNWASAGAYPIIGGVVATGTHGGNLSFCWHPTTSWITGYPTIYHSEGGLFAQISRVSNTTTTGDICAAVHVAEPFYNQTLRSELSGVYTVSSGTNAVTFSPLVSGTATNSNANLTATFTSAGSGTWRLVRTKSPGNNWFSELWINGVETSNATTSGFAPPTSGVDQTWEEQATWSAASSSNVLDTYNASLKVIDDPIWGY